MKQIFSFIVGVTLVASISSGQNDGALVPIGFINAVGLAEKTDFQIDAKSIKPAGFVAGAYASSFGVPPGNHGFSFTNGSCERASSNVAIKEGISPLYVLYKLGIIQRDRTVKNVLKIASIPPQARSRGAHFFAFSTLEGRRADIKVNGAALSIDPLKLSPIAEGSLLIEGQGNKPLRCAPRETGNYIVVLFDGSDSRTRWSLVEMTN